MKLLNFNSFFLLGASTAMVDTTPVTNAQTCPSLIWSDEFDGTSLDETNTWSHQHGDGCSIGLCGWGNAEWQDYQPDNTQVSDGFLTITADKEILPGGHAKYTSSRINTIGKKSFQYGLFEARIKIPTSQGLWPAFWMLGDDIPAAGWPGCGELDIMENIGREVNTVHGTMHFGQPWPNNQYSGESVSLPGADNHFSDDFHVFGMEKFEDLIRMHVDGVVYLVRTPEDIAPELWPFNQPFHFLLNIAIGGFWPGNPDETTIFPSTMEVDYIRVYDSVFGDLSGPKMVSAGDEGVIYYISDGLSSYDYEWSVPEGATITSGQGTSIITVTFGPSTGFGTVSVTAQSDECGSSADRNFSMPISISGREFPFLSGEVLDVEDDSAASVMLSTGTLEEMIANPILDDPINLDSSVFRYQRNETEQYDVIFLSTDAISNPKDYTAGGPRHFRMDVHTTAPAGTTVMLQLENSERNLLMYPAGRHSRYDATLEGAPGWQRLSFEFVNFPDPTASEVDRIVLFFAPNSFTNDVYYFDNLDSYSATAGAGSEPSPSSPPSSPVPTTSPEPTSAPVTAQPTRVPSIEPTSFPTTAYPTHSPSIGPSASPTTSPAPTSPTAAAVGIAEEDDVLVSGQDTDEAAALVFATGTWKWMNNPIALDPINSSPTVVEYSRDGTQLYDVIFYSTDLIANNPDDYASASPTKYFTMDVYAPSVLTSGETSVFLQLENSARPGEYPIGRHSRYAAKLDLDAASKWTQLRFEYVDSPDETETIVDKIVLLFAPGTFSDDAFYYDNLVSRTSSSPP